MAICPMPKKIEPFLSLGDHDFHYLNSEKSLTKKMYIMEDMLSMTMDEQFERQKIVNDIFNFLRPYYPECDVLIFGSSANGFGLTGCDLDLLFLPFPEYCNLDFKDKGSGLIPIPYHVLKDSVRRNKLYHMDEEMHLKFVQRVMYTTKKYFKKVFFVPAKCPILNIEFTFSPLHCDLSASNRFVLHNTQLLFVYGNLDSRVKPLLKFLRFWSKSLGFISKSLLSSYCLSLLVVFFLQNTHPAVLPSVRYLNEISDYSRIIDGWETAICLDPEYINAGRSENQKSLAELLIEFFDFYWNFDFIQNIVSVYKGKPLPVKLVKESKDERIRTFSVTPFSVQDPFILSRNVSRNTSMKTSFKLSLLIATDLLHKKDFDFRLLFDPSYYQDEINAIFAPTKANLRPDCMLLTFQLTYQLYSKLDITSHLYPWFDKVCQSMFDILQYGLLFECEVIDKTEAVELPTKKRKSSNVNNIGNMKHIVSIQCVANFPTFFRRSRVEVLEHLKKTDANFEIEDSEIVIPDFLKTDYKISKELSKDEIKNVIKLPEIAILPLPYFSFVCDCFHYPDSRLSDVLVSFAPLTNQKIYNGIKEFLRTFVLKHFRNMLQEV